MFAGADKARNLLPTKLNVSRIGVDRDAHGRMVIQGGNQDRFGQRHASAENSATRKIIEQL